VRKPSKAMPFVLMGAAAMMSLSVVAAVLISRFDRAWFPYESVLLVTLYCYFLAGLLYRQAIIVSMVVAVAYLVGRRYTPDGLYSVQYEAFYVILANSIGWIGLYFFEYHQRLSFLLERELGQRALLDGLTGTMNRVAIRKHLNVMWRQGQRDGRAVAVMIVDIDNFKLINDEFGHLAGDACLRAIADVLATCGRRPLDAVGRFGGDEFLVAWYDLDEDGFGHLCEMILEAIAKLRVLQAPDLRLQISAGAVLAWPTPECRLVQALQLADSKLYQAKRGGRGTIFSEVCRREEAGLRLVNSA
jgi:diguanylate cyclase (GGDEF)-like protein